MTVVVDEQVDHGNTLQWPATTPDGIARAAALSILGAQSRTATSVVTYHADGSLLIVVDDEARAEGLLEMLPRDELHCTFLVADPERRQIGLSEVAGLDLVHARVAHFSGHLGQFLVRVAEDNESRNLAKMVGHQREEFDLVLDLGAKPLKTAAIPPPGYFAPGSDAECRETLQTLPEMVGEFDKPKYFHYDPDICAHASSRIVGCTRCLDACPTVAIRSLADRIEVDPFLCQGGGICATACPTGAITYQFPRVSDLLDNLRRALRRYHDEQGRSPWLLILDDSAGADIAAPATGRIPESVIPVMVEEVGSLGMDGWLSALCYGAHGVSIGCTPVLSKQVRDELRHQVEIANTLLAGFGLPSDRIRMLDVDSDNGWWSELPSGSKEQVVTPTGFAAMEEKRTALHLALDHLYENAPKSPQRVELPEGSPFGTLNVDSNKCTLCMACVSVCPSSALYDGEDLPKLQFIENNCVQCGICERACPEGAIDLHPSYTCDSEKRSRKRTLHEEKPFLCVHCSKPFTTEKMMERIRSKLSGHWMYQDPKQRKRLEMCEDCRVEDMFADGGSLDVYDKPGDGSPE
ncbi:MAG: 4Fe-4S binding protein [Arenicellales bacterium]